jgi:hypothetical protein
MSDRMLLTKDNVICVMGSNPRLFGLCLMLCVACSAPPAQPEADVPTPSPPSPAQDVAPPGNGTTLLSRNWIAAGITFNGTWDPNFDASQRIDFIVNSDGSYRMSSASASTEGTWQLQGDHELFLMDATAGGVQRFGIDSLTERHLALRLLDEVKAEVVLHYRAE